MGEIIYVAVVDDHTMFRQGLIQLLGLFPEYRLLLEAGNGNDFIGKLKPSSLPDIVLLDIAMPEMDGYETMRWLHSNYPEIKVLALSSMDSEFSIIRMIKEGARGYILKDSDTKELKLALKELLENGYYYNEIVTRKLVRSVNSILHDKTKDSLLVRLTDKEMKFLKMACSEKTYKQIASEMFLSERTIDGYRESLFKKLHVNTRVGLVIYAMKNSLVQP
jgi:DNA-binding NarL/FixJ family response regulator